MCLDQNLNDFLGEIFFFNKYNNIKVWDIRQVKKIKQVAIMNQQSHDIYGDFSNLLYLQKIYFTCTL